MYRVSVAVLHCAECNLKKYWREPKSSEEVLCRHLEFGITMCIYHLISSEIYHWNKPKTDHRHYLRCTTEEKKSPVKLRKRLVGLLKISNVSETENERIFILRTGIRSAIKYLQRIKKDGNYLNSKALQDVQEHLSSLLEMKIPDSNQEGQPME